MSSGSTTEFILVPEGPRSNRHYLLMLGAFFWTLCIFCTGASVLYEVFSRGPLGIIGSPFVIGAALIPNIAIAFAFPQLQRFQRTHRYLLIGAFLAGAIIAIPPALVINTALFLPIEISASSIAELVGYGTIAGIVEEGIKGLILLFIFLRYRDEFHDEVDGIALGALVGLGFAMTEDISYFFRGLSGGGVIGFALTLFLRLGLGWMNHSVYTAITGAALGFSRRYRRGSPARWLLPLGGYAIAASLHNTFNFLATLLEQLLPDTLLGLLISVVPLYFITWTAIAILGFVVIRGWHRQADLVRAELPEEVDRGVLTAKEYFALPSPAQRKTLLREVSTSFGPVARQAQGKLLQLAISLAWQRRHSALGDPPGVPALHSEEALRGRILALRPLLNAVPAAGPQLVPAMPSGGPGWPPPAPPSHAFAAPVPQQGYDIAPPTMLSPTPPPRATPVPPPRPTPTVAGADVRGYQFVIAAGQQSGKTVLLHDGLTIGRNPRLAFLVLSDPEVSSLHARIARDGGPPILIDANSTNGTFVNGERITNRALQAGDEIAIGGVRLLVQITG
jgi:RsiW-degrading membrane proteinase PrsW (M82 family)